MTREEEAEVRSYRKHLRNKERVCVEGLNFKGVEMEKREILIDVWFLFLK